MPYLIDGNNFIGQFSPYPLRDPKSRYWLIGLLIIYKQIKKKKILLVFDGPPDPSVDNESFRKRYFKVYFPELGQNADAIIKDVVSKQQDLKKFYLVSSDRELKSFARKQGAHIINGKDFNRELKMAKKVHRKIQEEEKDVSLPSNLEIQHWIEIFRAKHG